MKSLAKVFGQRPAFESPPESSASKSDSSVSSWRSIAERRDSNLYPVQKSNDFASGRSRDRECSVDAQISSSEPSRKGSVFSIQIKANDREERRWSATEIVKNWRNITIEASLEKEAVVQKLDSILDNLPLGVYEQAKRARKLGVKCMWLFLVLIMHLILIYEISARSIQYYYNPVITTFAMKMPPSVQFPRVYICWAASANRTFMLQHPKEFEHSKKFRERIVKTNRRKKRAIDALVDAEYTGSYSVSAGEIEDYLTSYEQNRLVARARRHSMGEDADDASADDVYDFFYNAGYNVEETFLECSFREGAWRKLNCLDLVEPVLDINYGLCYSVRSDRMNQTVAGEGLRLLIKSHTDLYPTDDGNAPRSSGVYVSVSKDYDATNWLKACAAPGRYAKIDVVKATRVRMLNLERGSLIQRCIDENAAKGLMKIFNSTYSITSCQLDCMLQEFNRRCRCILLVDKKLIRNDLINNLEFCTPNRSQSCIVPNVTRNKMAMANINKCRAKCYTPCDSWRFDMRTSAAALFPPAFASFDLRPNATTGDLIRIDVSFPSIEYAELTQFPSLTPFRLIADIGGLMNLWMSASVITILAALATLLRYIAWKILSTTGYKI